VGRGGAVIPDLDPFAQLGAGVVRFDLAPQGSPDWVAQRRDAIGASECAAITGVSPYRSEADVRHAKAHPDALDTYPIRRGHHLEPFLLAEWQRWHPDAQLYRCPWPVEHPDEPRLRVNLDGWSPGLVIECKDSNHRDRPKWVEWASTGVPRPGLMLSHWTQVQALLEVTRAPMAHVVADAGKAWILVEVERDADAGATIVEAVRRFWAEPEWIQPDEPEWIQPDEIPF